MMVNAESRLSIAMTSVCGFAMFTASGCVMQSTYEAAVQEGLRTKTELARALEEHKTLTRQASDMELLNTDALREAESAAGALQRAKDDAEYERQQVEQHITKLKQKLAQATKRQHSLQYEVMVAKENTAALPEMIDVYQRKVRDGAAAATPVPNAEPAVHKPFDPSTIPVPQDLPPAVAAAPQQPAPAPAPAPAPPVNRVKPSPPPPDEDWLTSIKNWLVSLWRSVFS
jgi:hypothetical protein